MTNLKVVLTVLILGNLLGCSPSNPDKFYKDIFDDCLKLAKQDVIVSSYDLRYIIQSCRVTATLPDNERPKRRH